MYTACILQGVPIFANTDSATHLANLGGKAWPPVGYVLFPLPHCIAGFLVFLFAHSIPLSGVHSRHLFLISYLSSLSCVDASGFTDVFSSIFHS